MFCSSIKLDVMLVVMWRWRLRLGYRAWAPVMSLIEFAYRKSIVAVEQPPRLIQLCTALLFSIL
jgi:hypothetical protein